MPDPVCAIVSRERFSITVESQLNLCYFGRREAGGRFPDSGKWGKDMIRTMWIVLMLCVAVTVGAEPLSSRDIASGPGGRIKTLKTAEWEGDWVSVSSQVDYLTRQGVFEKAARESGTSAGDIRRAFLARFSSNVGSVRIHEGRFIFLTADGATVLGVAQYTYGGFVEQVREGREIQWHRFTLAGGFGRYPVLILSEPYGPLGQWLLVQEDSAAGAKTGSGDAGKREAMMIPADLAGKAIGDALDTPEFVSFLLSLAIPEKNEGGREP